LKAKLPSLVFRLQSKFSLSNFSFEEKQNREEQH